MCVHFTQWRVIGLTSVISSIGLTLDTVAAVLCLV